MIDRSARNIAKHIVQDHIESGRIVVQWTMLERDIAEALQAATQGWICPKCGRVYCPAVKECSTCNSKLESK